MLASFVSHTREAQGRKVTSVTDPRNLLPRLFTSSFFKGKALGRGCDRQPRVQMIIDDFKRIMCFFPPQGEFIHKNDGVARCTV